MLEVGLTFGALNAIWVASVSRVTCTYTPVIPRCTMCIYCTVAWVYTFLVSASFGCWAFRVSETFILSAYFVRVASVTRQAVTLGPVVPHWTLSILATSLKSAWILALSPNTCQVLRTFVITLAASWWYKTIHDNLNWTIDLKQEKIKMTCNLRSSHISYGSPS